MQKWELEEKISKLEEKNLKLSDELESLRPKKTWQVNFCDLNMDSVTIKSHILTYSLFNVDAYSEYAFANNTLKGQ